MKCQAAEICWGSLLMAFWIHTAIPFAAAAADPAPPTLRLTDPIPYGRAPIDYHGSATDNAVARLKTSIEAGRTMLAFDPQHGYLPSLLAALEVPIESQMLVFSKTALNPQLVGPQNPRALYFNDDVYVGWVPGAAAIELTAIDPAKGAVFYKLPQDRSQRPRLTRESNCLACHAGSSSLQVPGLMVRSFTTDSRGKPLSGFSQITSATAFEKRFGGWYVTGSLGRQIHRANVFGPAENEQSQVDASRSSNLPSLHGLIDSDRYLSPYSDVVAQLVLHHQAHGQNLLIRVGHESRLGLRSDAEDELLRYLLFVDEQPLTETVAGTSGFAEWFERQDEQRSRNGTEPPTGLRTFDLQTRLFRHRLSYLVETSLFDALPADAKARLYRGLWDVLQGRHPTLGAAGMPKAERRAMAEQLRTRLPEIRASVPERRPGPP